jgi:hypothetical protein
MISETLSYPALFSDRRASGKCGVLTVVGSFEFGRRDVTASFMKLPVVEPADIS